MSDYHAISQNLLVANTDVSVGLKGNIGYAVPISEVAGNIEIEERCGRACNGAYLSLATGEGFDIRRYLGFVGHDSSVVMRCPQTMLA
jgi:hypothetical protein